MKKDSITEIGIDEKERLYIMPSSVKFPYIYREAMEVHWDAEGNFLFSPKPREWTYLDWFKQIINAAEEQGYSLRFSNATKWNKIPDPLRYEINDWADKYYSDLEKQLK